MINNNAGNAFGSLNSTLNMQGGMVTQGGSNFVVDDAQGTATYNQTGGTYVCESTNGAWIGNSTATDSGIMTVSGAPSWRPRALCESARRPPARCPSAAGPARPR